MGNLRVIPTLIIKYILRILYGLFTLLYKVDSKKVTFASYRSNDLRDNLLYIYNELNIQDAEYEKTLLFSKLDSSITGKVKYVFHMIKACYHLATSKYFILDDYYMPVYLIRPRKGTEIIQVWHCSGALKKFGHSTVGSSIGPSEIYLKHVKVHGNYTKSFVSSTNVIPYFAEAFKMSEKDILPLGSPRTDYLFDTKKHGSLITQFSKDHPELTDKKIILYAPTYRGKSHYQGEYEIPINIKELKVALSNDYILLIKLHPYMQSEFSIDPEFTDFVITFGKKYSIQELSVLSDMLITDYSTVFFDYSLLNKPMIFFPYDLQEYIADRDFYYDYEGLVPGPLVTDTKSLIEVITRDKYDYDQIEAFRDTFFDYQDGKASERIVHNIFEK